MLNVNEMLYNFQKPCLLREIAHDTPVSLSTGGALPDDAGSHSRKNVIIISVLTVNKYVLGHHILFILI